VCCVKNFHIFLWLLIEGKISMKKYYLIIILISFLPVVFSACVQTPIDLSNENETLIFSMDEMFSKGMCRNMDTVFQDSTIKKVRLSFTLETDCPDSTNNVTAYFILTADTDYIIDKRGVMCNFSLNQTFEISTAKKPLKFLFGVCSWGFFYIKLENIKLFKVNN